MGDSIERFEKFFGWKLTDEAQMCQINELQRELLAPCNNYDKRTHPELTPAVLDIIRSKNKFDLELFEYAKFMFKHQGLALFHIRETPDNRTN